jgi:trans-2,3-dihydro-3-hydroxyanthranilate isomerase
MPRHRFYQLDVFTTQPLTGNALAVFPDARGLDPRTMQALAREMNLSETTFVFPSTTATRHVRFFTPTSEIPLAGHPTVGTWWLLAELGLVPLAPDGATRITQETAAGVLPVDLEMRGGKPVRVVMTQRRPEFGATVTARAALGKALGGDATTVSTRPVAQVVSTAMPQLMIPIRSLEVLRNLPSGGSGMALAEVIRKYQTDCAMCYTLEAESADATVHCRMFAPGLGVPEDPATGSAAGALGCYLVRNGKLAVSGGRAEVVIEQGIEIGRPSIIYVDVAVTDGEISQVRVGGEAVTVIEGEVRL